MENVKNRLISEETTFGGIVTQIYKHGSGYVAHRTPNAKKYIFKD